MSEPKQRVGKREALAINALHSRDQTGAARGRPTRITFAKKCQSLGLPRSTFTKSSPAANKLARKWARKVLDAIPEAGGSIFTEAELIRLQRMAHIL